MLHSVAKVGTHFGYGSGTADQHSCSTVCTVPVRPRPRYVLR